MISLNDVIARSTFSHTFPRSMVVVSILHSMDSRCVVSLVRTY
jgi:hypothetical protein